MGEGEGEGDLAQLVKHRTGTPITQVPLPGTARDFFLPESTFSADSLSYCVRTPPCAAACIYSGALIKDPVVHVRVGWIMETLKHPACTLG